MLKRQHKNKINSSKRSMSLPDSRYLTTNIPEYSNTDEAQEKDLKNKFMQMTEVLKEEIKKIP